MLFDPSRVPNVIPEDQKENARAWIKGVITAEIWTGAQVCEFYKISQPTLSKLVAKEEPAFVVRMGNTMCFVMHFAKPWLDNIVVTHIAKVSRVEGSTSDKPNKPGRPKDVWRNYIDENGNPARLPEEYESGLAYWHAYHKKEFEKFIASPAADNIEARKIPKEWLDRCYAVLAPIAKVKRSRSKKV